LFIGNLLQSQEVTPSSHHSIMRWLLESASCHLIATKDLSDVTSCCRQLHDPIFATFGVNGACCKQNVRFENNRDLGSRMARSGQRVP
jgi:hypothetical protein